MNTFRSQIEENQRKSFWLIAIISGLTAALGAVLPGVFSGGFDPRLSALGLAGALAFAGSGSLVSYFQGVNIIMSASGARKLLPNEDPQLRNVVEEMAIAGGSPAPEIYLIDDTALNAFASGRDPEHAAIAITTGLRDKLTREELQAVIAHEMGHVVNYDIRLMMLTAVMAGAIVLMCDAFWRILRHGGLRSRRGSGKGAGGTAIIILVLAIVLAIISPIVARLLQLAVSRQREFLADATSVRLTRNPEALISALLKLSSDTEALEAANRATEHLYIVSPTRKLAAANIDSVWSTHPPIKERVNRIRSLVR